jgi:hypothetical protein
VTDPVTRALRAVGVASGVVGPIVTAASFLVLPDVVPVHFDALGTPDAEGGRWTVLALAAVWLGITALLVVLGRMPQVANFPMPVTEANAQQLYREAERMLVWLTLATNLTFAGVLVSILTAGAPPGAILIWSGVVAVLASTIVGIARMMRG